MQDSWQRMLSKRRRQKPRELFLDGFISSGINVYSNERSFRVTYYTRLY